MASSRSHFSGVLEWRRWRSDGAEASRSLGVDDDGWSAGLAREGGWKELPFPVILPLEMAGDERHRRRSELQRGL